MLTMNIQMRKVAAIPKFNSRSFSLSSSLSVEQFSKSQMVEVRFLSIKEILTQSVSRRYFIKKKIKRLNVLFVNLKIKYRDKLV